MCSASLWLGTDNEQRRVLAMHRHNTNKNVVESLIVTTFNAEILENATYVNELAIGYAPREVFRRQSLVARSHGARDHPHGATVSCVCL